MIVLLLTLVLVALWISYELWKAPIFDNKMNLIREEKTFKDLFSFLKKKK